MPVIETLTDTVVSQCWDWAIGADSVSGQHYAEAREQTNPVIRQKQLWKGKIGEFAVYQFLKKEGVEPTLPELDIKRQYKHNPDLISYKNKTNFHVKTSIDIRQGSRSWVFERNNTITTNPNDNDYLCLCSLIIEPNTVRIDIIEKATNFIGQYKPLINENLVTKCCLYAKDFPSLQALDFPVSVVEFNPGF